MTTVTPADYDAIFARERAVAYPTIDALEARCGAALDRSALEAVARVLACPLKAHPPNWQHGRVLYALTRAYLRETPEPSVRLLDIGTAKGFSAWALQQALVDASVAGEVVSVDVIDPAAALARNSIADCAGPTTLAQLHAPWPILAAVSFQQATGLDWLRAQATRIHVAFLDGKHERSVVFSEGRALATRQCPGDLAIFDDTHLPNVAEAVAYLGQSEYRIEYLPLLPQRQYALGVRR